MFTEVDDGAQKTIGYLPQKKCDSLSTLDTLYVQNQNSRNRKGISKSLLSLNDVYMDCLPFDARSKRKPKPNMFSDSFCVLMSYSA